MTPAERYRIREAPRVAAEAPEQTAEQKARLRDLLGSRP
jgi:hypothetical protein